MLSSIMRTLAYRAPAGVPRVPVSQHPRHLLLPRRLPPVPCYSSAAIQTLLRPGTGQLRTASAVLHSSLFGGSSRPWEQYLGAPRLRLRTGEHSRHQDPRGEPLRQVASAQAPRSPQSPAAAEEEEPPAPSSTSGSSSNASSSVDSGNLHSGSSSGREDGAGPAAAHDAAEGLPHAGAHAEQAGGHGHGGHGINFREGVDAQGNPLPAWKLRLGQYLESNECHMIVISLVMLDLTIVVTELILGSLFTHGQPMPHAVHVAEEILSWSSIGILCLFATELLAKLACFGTQYFGHSRWHMVDAVVVTLSLGLELTLKGVAGEAASLLMFFRLWKYTPEFLRVARHAPEVAEVARVARHTPEALRVLSHTPEFLRLGRHLPEFLRVGRHLPEALRAFRHVPEFFRFVRHSPEVFRLWRVARIAHASAEAMALQTAKEQEEARHALAAAQKELAAERGRVRVLEAEVAAMKQYLTPEQQAAVMAELLQSMPTSGVHASVSRHQQASMDRVWEAGLAKGQQQGQHGAQGDDRGCSPGDNGHHDDNGSEGHGEGSRGDGGQGVGPDHGPPAH